MPNGKCFVEIFCKKDYLLTFDFGEFAIVVEYLVPVNKDNISFETGKNYEKRFINFWHKRMGSNPILEPEEISLEAFGEIKENFKNWMLVPDKKLWALLEKYFSKYVKKYKG